MDYNEALKYIEGTGKFGINLGLKRIERLCELMGSPEKDLKVIHVAGTNGKGSTTTFISSMLKKSGYKVGIYTSPYIERFTERIRINDDEISKENISRIVTEMVPHIDRLVEEGLDHPTEFEIITAAAFKYFSEMKTDFVVLEVGLGGRFDATNVITPLVSVITTISFDHVNILGDTLGKIAYEKAGIIKSGVPVVVYPQEKEAMDVISEVAQEKKAGIYFVSDSKYEVISNTVDGIVFNVKALNEYKNLKINMLADYQVMNAITAITAIDVLKEQGIKITDDGVLTGLEGARWPGRFEILKRDPYYVVLDGAHNIQGIKALTTAARRYFNDKKIKIVCGMLGDKSYEEMIGELSTICEYFIAVTPNSNRALPSDDLKGVIESNGKYAESVETIEEGVKRGLEVTKDDEVLLFCGSLYMIGAARTELANHLGDS